MKVLIGLCVEQTHFLAVPHDLALAELENHHAAVRRGDHSGPAPDPHASTARWLSDYWPSVLRRHGRPDGRGSHTLSHRTAPVITDDLITDGALQVYRCPGLAQAYADGGRAAWLALGEELVRVQRWVPQPFPVSDVPWGPYFLALHPRRDTTRHWYANHMQLKSGLRRSEELWAFREQARQAYALESAGLLWTVEHPTVILRHGYQFLAVCLACTWIDPALHDGPAAKAAAQSHAISAAPGGQPHLVREWPPP